MLTSPSSPPLEVPGFSVYESIGKGAFGVVVKATHNATGALLALKMNTKDDAFMADPKLQHRVRSEARVLKLLAHANVVRCFGSMETDDFFVLCLELVQGKSCADLVSSNGAMEETTAAPIILQIARALRHCHQRKISHRDVKITRRGCREGGQCWREGSGGDTGLITVYGALQPGGLRDAQRTIRDSVLLARYIDTQLYVIAVCITRIGKVIQDSCGQGGDNSYLSNIRAV